MGLTDLLTLARKTHLAIKPSSSKGGDGNSVVVGAMQEGAYSSYTFITTLACLNDFGL
jgi:hypothetical protein